MDSPPPARPRIVLASRNEGKLREMRALLAALPADFVSAAEAGAPEVEEHGETFEENAAAKAVAAARATGSWAIADDSGLAVPFLKGAPGVRSSRYSTAGTDKANNEKLLAELRRIHLLWPAAKFVCVAVLASPEGVLRSARGEVAGAIATEARGTNGFGYDPLFFCHEIGKTFGEATPEEKAAVSHRARAFRLLAGHLASLLGAAR